MAKIFQKVLLLALLIQPILACRLWAVLGKSQFTFATMSYTERLTIYSELNSLFQLSAYYPNGWTLMRVDENENHLLEPLYRSGNAAIEESNLYWSTADSLMDGGNGFMGLGHIRAASSGSVNISNPHPWIFHDDEISYTLSHNGTVDKSLLYNLMTNNGMDESWINAHPPQTFGAGYWKSTGWASVVDSELILLYLMQKIDEYGEIMLGLQSGLKAIIHAGVLESQINIIFSDGHDIYIFGGDNRITIAESSEHFVAMSQVPSEGLASTFDWIGIQKGEMVLLQRNGKSHYPDFIDIISDGTNVPLPSTPQLFSPYPNPFNGKVSIPFHLATLQETTVRIFSIRGALIDEFNLSQAEIETGLVSWIPKDRHGQACPSGVYVVSVQTDTWSGSKKIVYLK